MLIICFSSAGSAVQVDRRTLLDREDIHLLGTSLTSHVMCRYGKDLSQSQRSSVGVRLLLEDIPLKILPYSLLNIACTLAVFDILPPVDEKLEVKASSGELWFFDSYFATLVFSSETG